MPSLSGILSRFTKDAIVYWKKTGDDAFSKPIYAIPVQVMVRWEDKQVEIVTADGRKIMSKSYMLLSSEITLGSWVWLGRLTDWQASSFYPSIPTNLQGGREVIKVQRSPGIPQLPGNVFEVFM